jgi:hypothetical protein
MDAGAIERIADDGRVHRVRAAGRSVGGQGRRPNDYLSKLSAQISTS